MTRASRPSLRQLEAFVAVSDEGTFAAAGARLAIGQSSVSRSIAELEGILGQRVFDRGPRGAVLTAAGRRILVGARHALAVTSAMHDEAQSEVIRGTVTVGGFRSGASFLLPPVVSELTRTHPQIDIAIRAIREVDGGVAKAVLTGECDIGLTSQTDDPELRCVALADDPYVVVEPAAPPAGRLPFILWDERCSDRALAWLRETSGEPEDVIRADDDQVVLALVAEGAGWSLMPALATRPRPARVRMRPVRGGPQRTVTACVRPAALERPAVAAVFAALERLRAPGADDAALP